MAYADTRSIQRNFGTILLVGAVEIAIGAALVAGLAAKFVPKREQTVTGIHLPAPKPEPEPTVRPPEPVLHSPYAPPLPQPETPFQNPGPLPLPSYGPTPGPSGADGIGEALFPVPGPSPSPEFTGKQARPKGNPALWVTTNDYPQSAIRAELEGTVRFRLSIGTNGRVTGCEISGTSGHAALDQAACAKLSQRGRFEPASDGTGALVAGSYTGAVRWQLPME